MFRNSFDTYFPMSQSLLQMKLDGLHSNTSLEFNFILAELTVLKCIPVEDTPWARKSEYL
uniref:Uncharacterized protein n=1 Tax=Arion vulgaris TaxID=1028688 RepID=A0A0B7AAY2_9EUPU